MSYDFNFDGILNYDDDQAVSPDTVIAELGNQLEKATNGFIKGVVREYNGPIESYDQMSAFASIASALGTSLVHRDIQDNLGEIGYQEYKFEFFLTTSKLEDYKYRVLFFEYGIGMYPVKIVLEQGIADEIFKKENADYVVEYATKTELENVILNILKTKKVTKVMQELIYAMKRFERLDKGQPKLIEKISDTE
jgi:hypothetical protein